MNTAQALHGLLVEMGAYLEQADQGPVDLFLLGGCSLILFEGRLGATRDLDVVEEKLRRSDREASDALVAAFGDGAADRLGDEYRGEPIRIFNLDQEGGRWVADWELEARWNHYGFGDEMVFGDVNGDGRVDLVTVGDFLSPAEPVSSGLRVYLGCADRDGDGAPDDPDCAYLPRPADESPDDEATDGCSCAQAQSEQAAPLRLVFFVALLGALRALMGPRRTGLRAARAVRAVHALPGLALLALVGGCSAEAGDLQPHAVYADAASVDMPAPTSMVVPLDGREAMPLASMAPGRAFTYQGRVFESMGEERVERVRATGDVVAEVVDTFERTAPGFIRLGLTFEDGTEEVLQVTQEHPFWVVDANEWLTVQQLARGMELRTVGGGSAWVNTIDPVREPTRVYNFEVAGVHNYYARMVDGAGAVLTHNASKCEIDLGGGAGASKGADAAGSGRTFVTDSGGNTLIVPEGGRVTGSPDGKFVQTRRADGSISQRKDQAHRDPAPGETPSSQAGTAPHGHGMDADGNSLDVEGNIVDRTSPEAHWDAR